jgi:AcrR family transcriptional regulator
MASMTQEERDGRRVRGERTRRAVLDRAVQAASVDGLGGLTFGTLAVTAPVNKSGIAGLFGSKEGLQLATVAYAREVFTEVVVDPARGAERGLPRLRRTVEAWLDYSRGRVFAGGCFFRAAATELDARAPGPVRDAVVEALRDWDGYLVGLATAAVERGELAPGTDAEQLVFEVNAFLERADSESVLRGDAGAYDRAAGAIAGSLAARGAAPAG